MICGWIVDGGGPQKYTLVGGFGALLFCSLFFGGSCPVAQQRSGPVSGRFTGGFNGFGWMVGVLWCEPEISVLVGLYLGKLSILCGYWCVTLMRIQRGIGMPALGNGPGMLEWCPPALVRLGLMCSKCPLDLYVSNILWVCIKLREPD